MKIEIETVWQEIFILLDQGRFNQALVEMGKVLNLMLMLLQMKSCWWTIWSWKYSNSDTITDIEEELLAWPPIWYQLRWQLPEVQRVHLFPSGVSVTFNLNAQLFVLNHNICSKWSETDGNNKNNWFKTQFEFHRNKIFRFCKNPHLRFYRSHFISF